MLEEGFGRLRLIWRCRSREAELRSYGDTCHGEEDLNSWSTGDLICYLYRLDARIDSLPELVREWAMDMSASAQRMREAFRDRKSASLAIAA